MFSWSKPSSAYPASHRINKQDNSNGSYPNAISREEHIRSYVNHHTLGPSTRKVSKNDDATYDTVFQTQKGNTLILRVHVSSQKVFPLPSMILPGVKVSHPWVDSNQRVVGYAKMRTESTWNWSGMTLGDALNEVVRHLQLNPPIVLEITETWLRKMQGNVTPQYNNEQGSSSNAPPAYDAWCLPQEPEPEPQIDFEFVVPSTFSSFETMSKEEMKTILNDKRAVSEFVSTLPERANLLQYRNSITSRNKSLATASLQKEETHTKLANEVNDLYLELKEQMKVSTDLIEAKEKLLKPPDANLVKKKLTRSKNEAFEESEDFAASWLDDNDMKIDVFIKEFMKMRKTFHDRSIKLDLMAKNM